MGWIDGSASAAATQNPIGTVDAGTNIVFGNGLLNTPNTNDISPTTSTSAVAALGEAADSSGAGTQISDQTGSDTRKLWLYGGIGLGTSLLAIALVRYRRQIFSLK